MSYIYNLTDTWNSAGTTFTAIKMNVTDTASAAGSRIIDFQIGGVSKLYLDKSGNLVSTGIQSGSLSLTQALGISSGGTGASTPAGARVALFPSLTGNGTKVLAVNAGTTDVEWVSIPGGGSVTSVNASGGSTGLTFNGGPISTSGTLTLGGILALASGGTGSGTAAGARTNILPAYTGNAGKILAVNAGATDAEWVANISAVTSVSGTAPIVSSGGATPAISISAATTSAAGSMSAADKTKLDGIASGANVGTVTSVSGTGTVNGLTLTGNITGSGSLTLGGTLALTSGQVTTALGFTPYNSTNPSGYLSTVNLTTNVTGTLPITSGGTGGNTAPLARTALGLGSAAVLNAGSANGVATLDGSGTVPTSQLPSAVLGGLNYQGTWNATTNTPTLTSSVGSKGFYYVVSTAGSTNLNSITDWKIGDWAVYDGSTWQKVDNTDAVSSVNSLTGAVVLTTTNIAEGTNLYFTQAAARGSISQGTGITYNSTTGVITNSAPNQTVALTGAGTTVVTGTYPNFTITSNDSAVGTVTGVTGTAPIVSSGGAAPAISISAATTAAAGSMSAADKTKLDGIATSANNYTLPKATATTLGGVEVFDATVQATAANAVSSTASRTYGIQLNAADQMVVNVPWVDTDTTVDATKLPLAGGTMTGAITFAAGQTWPTFNQNTTGTAATITGTYSGTLTSSQITTGLGFTPYNATNPNGYTANAGTVTGVTGTAPIVSSGGTAPAISISAATISAAGSMSAADKTKLDGIATSANNYTLPKATATTLGGVEVFDATVQTVAANTVSTTASRTYGIQLNAADQMVVNVPWVDTTTDATKLPLAGGTMTGAITFAAGQTWPTFNQNTTGTAATITGVYSGTITSSQITTGLGFTPYNSTNPNGYTSNAGTVTSVSGTANQIAVATGSTTPVVSLTNTTVTAGTYANTNLTVDAQGRITSASNGRSLINDDASVTRVTYPIGAQLSVGIASVVGAIKITLPTSWTDTMMSMRVRIYDYSGGESFEVNCGGYNYNPSTSWINTFAYIVGQANVNRNFTIRFGHDGTNCCIVIGEIDSVWSYPKIVVEDFMAGHSNFAKATWDDGWSISTITTLPTITSTISNIQVGRLGNAWYDSDNTAYYVDPSNTSNIVGLTVANTITGNISGSAASITGTYGGTLTSSQITTGLGFTPYNATNPSGYTSNVGTVTSVAMTVPTGLSVSGTPIASSGTLAVTLTSGYSIPTTASQTNWDTSYTDRLKWDGGATGLVAAIGRTSLGGTTVGSNLFTLTNPSAVTFLRVNADNTVSALDAATFRTAIGASSGLGTVTSVSVVSANGFAGTVATNTTTPAITISTSISGLLKGNGTAISAATAGTDYVIPSGSITGNAATVTNITANTGLLRNSLVNASSLDALTNANFRTTIFGSATSGYQIAASRWNTVIPTPFTGLAAYGTAMAWAGSDTQGFLAVNYSTAGAMIGGGNADAINWSATLLHSSNYASYAMPSGSSATNTVDVRSPRFYDSNNTAYYIDAASQSILNSLSIKNGSAGNILQAATSGNDQLTIIGQNYTHALNLKDNYNTSNYAVISGGYLNQASLTLYGYSAQNVINKISYYASDYATVTGIITGTVDVRAPIFYDTGDTAYYVDPNSVSVLSTVRTSYIQRPAGQTVLNFTSATYTEIRDPAARNAILLGNTTDPANYYDNTSHIFRTTAAANMFTLSGTGDGIATTSFRAPIFYDSDDTTYYTNPASNSVINGIFANRYFQRASGIPTNNLGDPTVTEMALFEEQFNNKTAFFPPANVICETSTDGITWTLFAVSDVIKKNLVGGTSGTGLGIPYGTAYFRVRFVNDGNYVYLNALYSSWSGNGHQTKVQIHKKAFGSTTWTAHTNSDVLVSSWPGHLYLPFSTIAYHPGTYTDEVAVVFIPTWNASFPSNVISLQKMQIWGGYPQGKRTGYSIDADKNYTFPASVRGTEFRDSDNTAYFVDPNATSNLLGLTVANTITGNVSGNAATATALQTARLINGVSFNGSSDITITATDSTKLPLAGGTLTGALTTASASGLGNGNARSLITGYSGGNYGQIGYGIAYTATSDVHNYAINDTVSMWEAFDGLRVRAASGGTVGTAITWTTVLDARRSLTSMTFKGNPVLDSSNYNSYSPTLTGGGASGTWSINVTGNAATVTNGLYTSGDQTTITGTKRFYSTNNTVINTVGSADRGLSVFQETTGTDAYMTFHISSDYAAYFGLGGAENDLVYGGWSAGANRHRILHSGNYTSWAPSLTGTGASGTWGINVTGNAATVASLSVHTGTNNEANKIVRTDANGYIIAGYINSANGNEGNNSNPSRVWGTNGTDSYLRTYLTSALSVSYAATAGSADQIDGIPFRNTNSNASTNADTIESNGITYYGAGVPNFTGNATDGALYSQAYSANWQHQIAGDFRSGQIALRGKNNGTWQSWRTVLDSGNFTGWAPSLTGTGASGTWGINVTGTAASAPLLSSLGNYAWTQSTLPTTYPMGIQASFVGPAVGEGSWQNYGSVMTMRTYAGGGGSLQMYVPYGPGNGGTGLQVRFGNYDVSSGNAWTSWKTLLASDNYTDYVPTKTGGGASGTWGINVTGTAASISGFNNPTTAATANTIVYRDGSGDDFRRYGFAEYFNMSHGASGSTTDSIFYSSGDNYIRKNNATGFRASLNVPTRTGGDASGTWGINVTGSAASLGSTNFIERTGSTGNLNTDFQNTPAGTMRYHGDSNAGTNAPSAQWWIYESKRHSNATNYWGTQVAWGWEDAANRLRTRNVTNGTFGGWIEYLNTAGHTFGGDLNMTGIIRSTNSDMRAPVFYDQDDTSTKVDPNGDSWFKGTVYINRVASGGDNNTFGGLELREVSLVANAQTAATYSPRINFHWGSVGAATIYMNSAGNFVFGGQSDITNNRRAIYCSDLYATGNVTAYYSDDRLKTRVGNIKNALDIVTSLNGFRYVDNDLAKTFGYANEGTQIGVSAQEVQKHLPEIVRQAAFDVDHDNPNNGSKTGENYLTVDYSRLVPLLIEAIKEQQEQINELKKKVGE